GQVDGAIEALQRLVAHEPTQEAAHVGLIRLYASTGRRMEALRQYQQLREALQRDLDATPDPASQRLYRAIFTGQFPPPRPAPTAAAGSPSPARVPEAPARPEARPRHNLPQALTTFIGRERAIAEVKQLLRSSRLVTLTGAGGSGKTRLALEVAAGLVGEAEAFPGGVWLVELAALGEGALVPQALAS